MAINLAILAEQLESDVDMFELGFDASFMETARGRQAVDILKTVMAEVEKEMEKSVDFGVPQDGMLARIRTQIARVRKLLGEEQKE